MEKSENQVSVDQGRSRTMGKTEHGTTSNSFGGLHSIDRQIARQKRRGIIWMSLYLLLLILALLFFVFGPELITFN